MTKVIKNFKVSANGSVFGVYSGIDRNAALLAHVQDAGYTSIEDAAAVLEKSVEDFVAGTQVELLAPLSERIEIVNAAVVIDENPHVAFDIAVDGVNVHQTLEWIDEDRDLVRNDCHLAVNRDWNTAVLDALGDDDIDSEDVYDVVHQKLCSVVEELKEAAEKYRLTWINAEGDAEIDGGDYASEPGSEQIKAFVNELVDMEVDDDGVQTALDGSVYWHCYTGDWTRDREDLGRSGALDPREYRES